MSEVRRKKVNIGRRLIGEGEPAFIIAEAGLNHNGNLKIALQMVRAANAAGADAVKFQTFRAETITSIKAGWKNQIWGLKGTSQYELFRRCELSYDAHKEIAQLSGDLGIIFFSSPSDTESVDMLLKMGVKVFKIGSDDFTNLPLLEYIAVTKLPMIISTGMATVDEIDRTIETVMKKGNSKIILLHCVSSYPMRDEDANLRAIVSMKKRWQFPVGYSDHSSGVDVPLSAVAVGAEVIEKHFILQKGMPGPEKELSIDSKELKELVFRVRHLEKVLGSGKKMPTSSELKMREVMRKSLAAKRGIFRDEKITRNMLTMLRPGTGIPAEEIDKIIGRKAGRDIEENELLNWKMIR